jgi:hypothetical protein
MVILFYFYCHLDESDGFYVGEQLRVFQMFSPNHFVDKVSCRLKKKSEQSHKNRPTYLSFNFSLNF